VEGMYVLSHSYHVERISKVKPDFVSLSCPCFSCQKMTEDEFVVPKIQEYIDIYRYISIYIDIYIYISIYSYIYRYIYSPSFLQLCPFCLTVDIIEHPNILCSLSRTGYQYIRYHLLL
jgi:hypothetical protein